MPSGYYDCDTNATTVWLRWTGTDSGCTTDAWQTWCGGEDDVYTTCPTSSAATVVWTAWATDCSGRTRVTRLTRQSDCSYPPPPARVEPTAEERAERERLAAERAEPARVAEEKRKADEEAADKRAEELLVAALDAEQREEYARDKSFHVRARTGRRYRIRRAWSGHVARVDDGREVERLCAHPRIRVPLPDNQLVAKLMLETDEEMFRRIANITPLGVGG